MDALLLLVFVVNKSTKGWLSVVPHKLICQGVYILIYVKDEFVGLSIGYFATLILFYKIKMDIYILCIYLLLVSIHVTYV